MALPLVFSCEAAFLLDAMAALPRKWVREGESGISYSLVIGAVFVSFSIALASSCRRAVMGAGLVV